MDNEYRELTNEFSAPTIFTQNDKTTPPEVSEEIRKLWADRELSNDGYTWFDTDEREDGEKYPVITEYLKQFGIVECLINYWW